MDNNTPTTKLSVDNLEGLNQLQLKQLLKQYQEENMPTWRKVAIGVYNVAACAGLSYYVFNNRQITSKFLAQPKKRTIFQIIKLGTMQALALTLVYTSGLYLVTGMFHPIRYFKKYSEIQAKIKGMTLRYDKTIQNTLLFETMRSFGLSEKLIQQARDELEASKKHLIETNQFSEESMQALNSNDQSFFAKLLASSVGEEQQEDNNKSTSTTESN